MQKMAAAFNTQISRDFAPVWGIKNPPPVKVQEDPLTPIPDGAWLVTFSDTIVDPGLLAAHWDEVGLPVAIIQVPAILAYGGTMFGPDGIPSAAEHEILEMLGDSTADQFFPSADPQVSLALEVCDPVQSSPDYEVGGVCVPNFVYPSWFLPDFKGPVDFRGACKSSGEVLPSGYVIHRAADGTITDVFGAKNPMRASHRRWLRHNPGVRP